MTAVELTTEEGGSEDTHHEQEEEHNQHEVSNIGDRGNQRHNGKLEAFIPRDESERPKDTQHSQSLEETDLFNSWEKSSNTRTDDYEIENVPSISNITSLAVKSESNCQDFSEHFNGKDGCHNVVNYLKNGILMTFRVVKRPFNSQQDCGEGNKKQNDPFKVLMIGHVKTELPEPVLPAETEEGSTTKGRLNCLLLTIGLLHFIDLLHVL